MATRQIVIEGDAILRKKSRPIENFNSRLWELLDDMAESMKLANGAGLAAVQVGILKRVAVIEGEDGLIELVNPKIVSKSGEDIMIEGCLSVPGKHGTVKRPYSVKVSAFDRHGKPFEITVEGIIARAVCHEIDHMDGVLFIDKVIAFVVPEEEDEE